LPLWEEGYRGHAGYLRYGNSWDGGNSGHAAHTMVVAFLVKDKEVDHFFAARDNQSTLKGDIEAPQRDFPY